MNASNVSSGDVLSTSGLSLWGSLYASLAEFALGNWWVILVGVLLFMSCVKHSLMSWEVRQDKRRLHCCYLRHCELRRAATQQQQQQQQQEESVASTAAAWQSMSGAAYTAQRDEPPAADTARDASDSAAHLLKNSADVSDSKNSSATRLPTTPSSARGRRSVSLTRQQEEAERSAASLTRVASLQLPLSSTSSSDLSFSLSPKTVTQQAAAATSRLLNRLTLSPSAADVQQGSSQNTPQMPGSSAASSEANGRRSVCFPKYTEDEQRLIDEKRQANAQAWLEAKRALDSTENFASCGVTPSSSATRRTASTAGMEAHTTEVSS